MASSSNIQDQPLRAPPPGVVPNLAHPESRAFEIYVAASVCLPFILLFAAMRFYAKVAILKRWTWDDVTCALGVLAGLIFPSLQLVAFNGGGYGKHLWEVTFKEFSANSTLLFLLVETTYGPLIWVVKLSLFVLYVQIFHPLQWLRYMAYAGAVSTGLFYLAIMVAQLVLCAPTDGHSQLAYLTALHSPRCSLARPLVFILGAVSVVSDLYLLILPLPAVWKLHLPFRRKLGVYAMFFTGSIACIASGFALAYRIEIFTTNDVTWLSIPLAVVSIVEFTAGILVCCMPTTTTVFKRLKSPISSFISSYRKGPRSFPNSSIIHLQPTHRDQSYESGREAWKELDDQESQRPSQYETGSSLVYQDAKIYKTTDIKVTR